MLDDEMIARAKADQAYGLWSDLEPFPHFMNNIESRQSDQPLDDGGTADREIAWDVETTRLEGPSGRHRGR